MFFSSVFVLTGWRWRQQLGMMLVAGLGLVVAVVLICSTVLFTEVATTAGLRKYAILAILISFLVFCFALFQATKQDVLTIRRESARVTRAPFWRRMQLDLIAGLVALIIYGFSIYFTGYSAPDARANTLLVLPLALVGPVCLIVACLLFFLRIFPRLLHLGEVWAARSRGAEPLLALGQLARAPRQALSITLLLALAITFAIFGLVFSASQQQRTYDVAAYQTGGDFSGHPLPAMSARPYEDVRQAYSQIAGVRSATPGYAMQAASANQSYPQPIELRAVDAASYAQTAIWTDQDSAQSIDGLMHQLIAQRHTALTSDALPAIVDQAAVDDLHLHIGSQFGFREARPVTSEASFKCTVVAIVQHIPTVNDSADSAMTADYRAPMGVLIDYRSFAALYQRDFSTTLPINTVWLRTRDDAPALAQVRSALQSSSLYLEQVSDRRAVMEAMHTDPLYLDLLGVLTIGTTSALVLALIGTLLTSWESARQRLTNFAVLRALGTTSRQLARVLTWEQSALYVAAILPGVFFGALLCGSAIPAMIYSGAPLNGITTEASSGQIQDGKIVS